MAEGLGRYLEELRVARRLTTAQLARKAGVRRATLSEWQAGKRRPRLPELEAVLGALGVSELQKQQAREHLAAPARLQRLWKQAESGDSNLESFAGHAPHGGDLIRALRLRRGWTQHRLAQRAGVSQATLVRWERAEQWPGTELLHRVCYLLQAGEDELVALTLGRFSLADREARLTEEEIQARLLYIFSSRMQPSENALVELRLLSLMGHAWDLAVRGESGQRMLAQVDSIYADYLYLNLRFAECRAVASRSLDIYADIPADCRRQDDGVDRAVIRLAEASAKSGGRQGLDRAIRTLEDWRSCLTDQKNDVLQSGWILADLARFKAMRGEAEEAVALGRQAWQLARHSSTLVEEQFRRYDLAEVLLQAGRPQEARQLLTGGTHPHFQIVDARIHFHLAEYAEADAMIQEALRWLDEHSHVTESEAPYYRHEALVLSEQMEQSVMPPPAAPSRRH